jgi:hypothetical protein
MPQTRVSYYPLEGGLDVVTPVQSMNPGRVIALSNFEPHFNGGYRRIDGFERFDGQPKPSEQTFIGFEVSASEDIVLGSTVTGAPSGATGKVIGIYEDDGTRGNDMLAVTKVTGTFALGDNLTTVTNADEDIVTDGMSATDPGGVLILNDLNETDEGVDFADSVNGLECVRDEWPGGVGVDTVTIPMTDLPGHVTTINSWTLRVRARVIRKGDAVFRNSNSRYVPSPESDDTVTYRFEFTPGADSGAVTFTDVDAGMDYITREITISGVATPAEINAEDVLWTQTAFAMFGDLFDGLTLEVDCIDVVVDYDGDVDILNQPVERDAPTQELEDEYLLAAQDDYRDDIIEVPGVNAVRSAWQLSDLVYAIRDNIGATAGIMHVESAAGWTTTGVTMADYILFDAGLAAGANVVEGDTLTGAVSGATATIHRIVLNGGSTAWDGSGEGYFVLTGVAGGPFQNNESLESPALTAIATADGANVTLAFSAGGRYEWVNHNFFAGAGTLRAYGVNGVDDFAFELDENGVVSPIFFPATPAGAADDEGAPGTAPFLIEEHRNYLWFGFPGGRYINSVIGEPLLITGFLGSNEFGAGDELTGLISVVGSVLVVLTERETRGLFGFDSSDFELKLLSEKSGSRLFGAQKVDTVYSLDDLGVSSLSRTDAFGDFIGSTVSQLVQPLVVGQVQETFTDSTIVRASNQYRFYFEDGSAFVMYIPAAGDQNRQRAQLGAQTRTGVMFGFLQYPFAISCIWNTEDGDGAERSYFITEDAGDGFGFVFQDRIGNNFDGEAIQSFIRTTYNFLKSPSTRKRFRRVDLEVDGQRPLSLKFVADMSFGVSDAENVTAQPDVLLEAGGGQWSIDNWDEFFWDGQQQSASRANIRGSGEAIGFVIFNESAVARPFVLQGLTVHYEPRRLQR